MNENISYLKESTRFPKEDIVAVTVPAASLSAEEWNKSVNALDALDKQDSEIKGSVNDVSDLLSESCSTITDTLKEHAKMLGGNFSDITAYTKKFSEITDKYYANSMVLADGTRNITGPGADCISLNLSNVKKVHFCNSLPATGESSRPLGVIIDVDGAVVRVLGNDTSSADSVDEYIDVTSAMYKLLINYYSYRSGYDYNLTYYVVSKESYSGKFSDYDRVVSKVKENTSIVGGDWTETVTIQTKVDEITDSYYANSFIGFSGERIVMGPGHGSAVVDLSNVKSVTVNHSIYGFSGADSRPIVAILDKSGSVVKTYGRRTGETDSINVSFAVQSSWDKMVINYTTGTYCGTVSYTKDVTTHYDAQVAGADDNSEIKTIADLPIGTADNYGRDVLYGAMLKHVFSTTTTIRYGEIIRNTSGKITRIATTSYIFAIKIKKQAGKCLRMQSNDGGMSRDNFDSMTSGYKIYQKGGDGSVITAKYWADVVYVSDDYVTIVSRSNHNLKRIYVTNTISGSDDTEVPFEMDDDLFGIFDPKYIPSGGILPNVIYKSRSEKLNSMLRGKTIITFGDSTWAYARYLMDDWGAIVYNISEGGYYMGYGDQGNRTWLCKDEAIQVFRNNKPASADYIINMTGSNQEFSAVPSADDLVNCAGNKRWYHSSDSSNSKFDALTESQKISYFKAPACYITAFWSLTQLYPNAQSVVVEPDFFHAGNGLYTSTKKWPSMQQFANRFVSSASIGEDNYLNKIDVLKEISVRLRAIYVPHETLGSLVNACYMSSDGVHPMAWASATKAASIARYLNFPPTTYNLIAADGTIIRTDEM